MSQLFDTPATQTLPGHTGRQEFAALEPGFFSAGMRSVASQQLEPEARVESASYRVVDIRLTGAEAPALSTTAVTPLNTPARAGIAEALAFEKTSFTSLTPPSHAHATQIVALFNEAYQGRYPNQRLANPKTLQQDIEDGKFILVAALNPQNNSVLGFGGLTDVSHEHIQLGLSGTVHELGKLVVGSGSQGLGLGTELLAARINLAARIGVDSLVSFAVTSHDYSQRSLGKYGFQPSGVHLCDWPVILKEDQRESAVAMHLFLNPQPLHERTVHVHDAVRRPLELAYQTLGCSRTLVVNRAEQTFAARYGAGAQQAFRQDGDSSALDQSAVLLFSSDALPADARIDTHAYYAVGYQHVSAKVNLMHPAATSQIEVLAQSGFRFASVQPLPDGDLLTMQAPRTIPADIRTALKLTHQTSRALLDSILAD